jgi:hypothetical protein
MELIRYALPVLATASTVLAPPGLSSARMIHVPQDQVTIQVAIQAASASDTVLIEPGTYHEAIDLLGKPILVASRYVLTGDPSFVSQTVIDASGIAGVPVARCASGETGATRLCGLTLTGGTPVGGGGVYCNQTSPVLDHLIITANSAQMQGGGVYAYGGAPTIRACLIASNQVLSASGDGGGVWAQYSSIIIEGSEIRANRAPYRGAGIFCELCTPSITANIIRDNAVTGNGYRYGGGLVSRNSVPVITGNLVENNDGGAFGGGMFY